MPPKRGKKGSKGRKGRKGKKGAGKKAEAPQPIVFADGMDVTRKMKHLRQMYIHNCREVEIEPNRLIVRMFKKLFNEKKKDEPPEILRAIALSRVPLTAADLHCLLAALVDYPLLSKIALVGCELDDECIQPISNYLAHVQGLEELDLSENRISVDGVGLISEALLCGCQLKSLNLGMNPLSDAGVCLLANGVRASPHMEKLVLPYCDVETVGGVTLARSLLCPDALCKLKVLDLHGNTLTGAVMMALGDVLGGVDSLQELFLSDIGHAGYVGPGGDEATCRFLDGLVRNQTLRVLDLSNNIMTREEGSLWVEAMEHNKTITKLHLPHLIGRDALKALIKHIQRNNKLAKPVKSKAKKKGRKKGAKKKKKK